MPLTSSQWQQVESLFSLAMQLPSERRYSWRRGTEPVDAQVGDEVDALIATCDNSAPYIDPRPQVRLRRPTRSAGEAAYRRSGRA